MRRLLLIPVALLGLFSASAFASTNHSGSHAVARITSLTSASITVGTRHHGHLTCRLTGRSPSLSGFAVGDQVRIACSSHVLVAIADRPGAINALNDKDVVLTSGISGTVTGIGPKFITVHDGDRTVTCTLDPDSPSITGYGVGSHVKIGCADGVLVSLGIPAGAAGAVTGGTTTTHNDGPAPTTTTTTTAVTTTQQSYTGITGAITTLTGGTIAVTSSGGTDGPTSLTCTIGPSSPSTAGFAGGNSVRMYCLNGALYQLKHNDTPPPTTATTTATTSTTTATTTTGGTPTEANGVLHALSADSITVGDLTCSIGPSSPSTSGFTLNQSVRMYCLNGALYSLAHN